MDRAEPASDSLEIVWRESASNLPRASVIVPGHNAGRTLEACLSALRNQDWPNDRYELIFVDDCSTDESLEIAARFADRIVKLTGQPRGPAAARNVGVEMSAGDVIVFIDADVVAPPHTVKALVKYIADDNKCEAVFGSYDCEPHQRALVSQYRNLLHHYVHQRSHEEAATFWAGCGAIRRASFNKIGGFSSTLYRRPTIEDIELGRRMRAAGMRIRLEKTIQVKHLKRWTAAGMIATDIFGRGIPWMRLILSRAYESKEIGDLNLTLVAMFSAFLVWSSLLLMLFSYLYVTLLPISLVLLSLCVVINMPTYVFFYRIRRLRFVVLAIPLHLLYHCCNGISAFGGLLCNFFVDNPPAWIRAITVCLRRFYRRHSLQIPKPTASIQVIDFNYR